MSSCGVLLNWVNILIIRSLLSSSLFYFYFLAIKYSDRMLPFLFQKFEQNNEKNRISSLTILKHLINSSEEQMLNKKQIIISSLRLLLTDPNNRVL